MDQSNYFCLIHNFYKFLTKQTIPCHHKKEEDHSNSWINVSTQSTFEKIYIPTVNLFQPKSPQQIHDPVSCEPMFYTHTPVSRYHESYCAHPTYLWAGWWDPPVCVPEWPAPVWDQCTTRGNSRLSTFPQSWQSSEHGETSQECDKCVVLQSTTQHDQVHVQEQLPSIHIYIYLTQLSTHFYYWT